MKVRGLCVTQWKTDVMVCMYALINRSIEAYYNNDDFARRSDAQFLVFRTTTVFPIMPAACRRGFPLEISVMVCMYVSK